MLARMIRMAKKTKASTFPRGPSAVGEWSYYAQLRIEALVRRFAPGWDYADEFPEKPPRIRWRTWARLCQAVDEWEAVRDDAFCQRISRFLR